jgi:hypothetical protein
MWTEIYVVGFILVFYLHIRNNFDVLKRSQIAACYQESSSERHFKKSFDETCVKTSKAMYIVWSVLGGLLWPITVVPALRAKTYCKNCQTEAYNRWGNNNGN